MTPRRPLLYPLIVGLLVMLPLSVSWSMKSSLGLPVKKITHASQIDSWQVIDRLHVVLSLSASRSYLVTLQRDCHALTAPSQLGISSSNNTVYAGFDYVTANGQRCHIKSINKLSQSEALALSS